MKPNIKYKGFVITAVIPLLLETCYLYNQGEEYILGQVSGLLGVGQKVSHLTTSRAWPHQDWWSRPCLRSTVAALLGQVTHTQCTCTSKHVAVNALNEVQNTCNESNP